MVNGDGRRALENRRQHGGGDIRQRRVIQRLQAAARLPPIVLPDVGGAGFAVHDALVAPHAHFVPQGELDHHVNRPERPDVVAHENAGIARKRLFPRRGHAGRDSTHNCAKAAIQSTNTICIEQLKSATDPQLAKELEDMAVNASRSKNLNIDVKQAKQELLLKKQSLQSQIVNDVDSVHQKNQKMADESGKRLSRLQRSRYIREKQSSDLQTKIETERRQAEEELMAYERERNELRRRYESDKKASENAANANMTAAGGHGWLIWLVLNLKKRSLS